MDDAKPPFRPVDAGSFVTLHYRIVLADGAEVISTFGHNPATLSMGAGQLAPALEDRLIGLREGEAAAFDLPEDAAYGSRKQELVQTLSRALLDVHCDAEDPYAPGDLVKFPAPNGGSFAGTLTSLTDQHAVLDFNHPLAGRALRFEVEIIGVM